MSQHFENFRRSLRADCFSDAEISNFFSKSDDSRYGMVKRLISSGKLIHLRRGLYCLGDSFRRDSLNLFSVANMIYGPSYVSFESALSYHGWIPEAVHVITSACVKRSKNISTPLGIFEFSRINARIFLCGVERVVSTREVFFVANPWRAIVDYMYAHKKTWKGISPLINSLRIEKENLQKLTRKELDEVESGFGNKRVSVFTEHVAKDLGL